MASWADRAVRHELCCVWYSGISYREHRRRLHFAEVTVCINCMALEAMPWRLPARKTGAAAQQLVYQSQPRSAVQLDEQHGSDSTQSKSGTSRRSLLLHGMHTAGRTRYTMRSLNRNEGRSGGVCSVASPESMGMTCGGDRAEETAFTAAGARRQG